MMAPEDIRRAAEAAEAFVDNAYVRGTVFDAAGGQIALAPHGIERAQGESLRELALAEAAEQTIEVGLGLGMSALFLSQAVLERCGGHVAIDPFQRESWNGAGLRTLRDAGVQDFVEVVAEESQLALPRMVREGRRFDFAFVDGDHRFEGVFLDLYFLTRVVRRGGLIVVDDMWMPSVRLAVAYVERNLGLAVIPDVLPDAFRWRHRRRLQRGVPHGRGTMAVIRLPMEPQPLQWDSFVSPF